MEKAPFVILILQRPEFCVLCIQTYVDNVACFLFQGQAMLGIDVDRVGDNLW